MGEPDLSQTVSRRVKEIRESRKWTQERLAEEVSTLGVPLHGTAVTRIEKGGRKVTLEEVAALAKALGVPPVQLTFPLGAESAVNVFRGEPVPTWDAVKWWTGEAAFPGGATDSGEWEERAAAVILHRWHDDLLEQHARAKAVQDGEDPGDEDQPEEIVVVKFEQRRIRKVREVERDIQNLRKTMRLTGIKPPALPPGLAHLEGEDGGGE